MINTPDNIALKEWASVCSALASGDQILLLRKGGIHERTFAQPADEFLLFPTFLHQRERQFKPAFSRHLEATVDHSEEDAIVEISHWCRVVETYDFTDLEKLLEFDRFVIFNDETIRERYAFRPDQAVRIMVVRAMRLARAVNVANRRTYAGCRSWIKIVEPIDLTDSVAVIDDIQFAQRCAEIRSLVGRGAADGSRADLRARY